MGANLSSTTAVDASKDIIAPGDRLAEMILGVAWLGAFYGMAMIFCTCALVDRWRGPHGDRSISGISVLAALLMSAAWPLVAVYLMMSDN